VDPISALAAEAHTVVALDDECLLQGLAVLRWDLGRLLEGDPPVLVVDVRNVARLSSATVAVLLRARRLCRARGGVLVLYRPSRVVLSVLRQSGLGQLFEVATTGLDPDRTHARPPVGDHVGARG